MRRVVVGVGLAGVVLVGLVGSGRPAFADHDLVTCTAGAAVQCIHLHGAAPDVLDALAVKVADELEARQMSAAAIRLADELEVAGRVYAVSTTPAEGTVSTEAQEVWLRVDEDWRYAGLLGGGAMLTMLAALVVGQMRRS